MLEDYFRDGEEAKVLAVMAVEAPLVQKWVHVSDGAPESAWAPPIPNVVEGNLELDRVDFDRAFQVASDGDAVWFGS